MRPHLATLVADFRRYGLQIAVVTHRGNRRFPSTYAQLAELSARCARAFDEHGVKPGDRVVLWGNNSVEWAAAFFGCIQRGIVAVPLDAAGSLDFAQRVIAEVQPRLLAGDLSLLRTLQPSPGIPVLGFSDFAASLPAPDYSPLPQLSRDTPLQIIFTSGTTAAPKGIVHTHGNVLASLDPLEKEIGKYRHYAHLVHPLRILQTLPLSHVFGQFLGLWVPSLLVAEVHFEDRLQAPRLARLMQRERISVMAAVPRVLELLRIWAEAEFPGLDKEVAAAGSETIARRWLRFRGLHRRLGFKFWAFVAGGAALPADLERFWTTVGFALVQGYGMTETTALVTLNHPFKTARGTIGTPLAGREVRLGDDGEILVRGPSVAAQVWREGGFHARMQDQAQQDWLATGDLATRDVQGHLVFAGRKSEVIVTPAGMNIHPEDLEAALRLRPGLRAALIVTQNTSAGPAPAAVLIPTKSDTSNEVLQRAVDDANRDLAPFQQIRVWLRWPQPEFPRTATGKTLRRPVQVWAQASLSSGNVGAPGMTLSDPLTEILRALGAGIRELEATDRLIEDLHLDSLAMVQLQSALETRFGVELGDQEWERVKTFGDLRHLLVEPVRPETPNVPPMAARSSEELPGATEVPARSGSMPNTVFPLWPGWGPVRLARNCFLECVLRPLLWLLLGPRVTAPVVLSRPMLLIANHRTALDVPLILYALSSSDREHVAVAMSDVLLTGWRHGKAQRHRFTAAVTPFAHWMVTALFNVFPLPRGAGLRRSFAHAGGWMDRNHHVLVFPEGRRSAEGRLQPFEPGIGLLALESQVPVVPIFVDGLGSPRTGWPKRGTISVRIGGPLTLEPGEEPQAFTRRLEAAMAALETI